MNTSFNNARSTGKRGGASSSKSNNDRTRGKSAGNYSNTSNANGNNSSANLSNEWIPTEAVRAIQKIKETFDGQMTETCVSQILYELNSIWRFIMRRENEAIKRKLTE